MYFASHPGAFALSLALTFSLVIPAFAEVMGRVDQAAPVTQVEPTVPPPTHNPVEEPMGREHRHEYPNMLGPMKTGLLVNIIKAYQAEIDAAKKLGQEEARTELERLRTLLGSELSKWAKQIKEFKDASRNINGMKVALDQLTLMTGAVKYDTFKLVVIKSFKDVIEQGSTEKPVGSIQEILNQFKDDQKRREARRIFSN